MMSRFALIALSLTWGAFVCPASAQTTGLMNSVVLDVDGQILRLGGDTSPEPFVVVMLDVGCPIVRRYAPQLNDIAKRAEGSGLRFYGVLSDSELSWPQARKFRDEFKLSFSVLMDASGSLAARLRPKVVPEAFVIDASDTLVYRGRIDDRFAAPGRPRARVTRHDLLDALAAVARGDRPLVVRTEPVGCEFEGWGDDLPENVTWARNVAPILNAHCVECHRAGAVGPFPLDTYKRARRRARMMARVVGDGLMPPWYATAGHGSFRDERVLTEREKGLLLRWAKTGAKEGKAGEAPPAPTFPDTGWRLGTPDLEFALPRPFEVPADGDDVYRYFVIPANLTRDLDVAAFDFLPGDASVVHHCIAYVDYSGWARKQEAKDPEPGFAVFDNTNGLLKSIGRGEIIAIGGWAPGSQAYLLPKGYGMKIPKGGDLVLEIHYHLTGKATRDQSRCALYLAKAPITRWVEGLVIGTETLAIPAGDAAYWRHVSMAVPASMDLLDIGPHMHFLGKEVEVRATLPDGSVERLLKAAWDFRWQSVYAYRTPVHLPKGSRIDAWFRFDNSAANPYNPHAPPKKVRWGWGSNDEMCELYLTIVPDDPKSLPALERSSIESWFRDAAGGEGPPWRRSGR